MNTLIKNGRIVTGKGLIHGDILIEGEKIIDISPNISAAAGLVIDACGKYILPGGVDQHVHFGYTYQGAKVRGYETSSAAIAGGTTTIADFVDALPGETRLEAFKRYEKEEIIGKAHCDYVLHMNLKGPTSADYKEIPFYPEHGISTVNLFLSNISQPAYARDDDILKIMDINKDAGITTFIHAENCDIADFLTEKLLNAGKIAPYYHTKARPVLIEEESTARVCYFSKITGAPIMITHLSSSNAVGILSKFRDEGAAVFGETCPHYLVLDEELLALPDFAGAKYVCNPPLRTRRHQAYLWRALKDGELICVGTDHCAFDWKNQKKLGIGGHHLIPKGIPGLQDRLFILWTYGVAQHRMLIEDLVDVFATKPAKVLGIYPQKGVLMVGSDADIVIFDPVKEGVFSNEDSLHGLDYNAYEGLEKLGSVDTVLLRGEVVFNPRQILNIKKRGRRVKCLSHGFCFSKQLSKTV